MSENDGGDYCRGPGRADKAITEAIEKRRQMERYVEIVLIEESDSLAKVIKKRVSGLH